MKIEAARDYYEVVVKPTIAEFLVSSHDVRRGRLTAIVLFHTWDYLKDLAVKPETAHGVLMYETIRAAANASKHFEVTNKKFPHIASKADQVVAEKNEGFFTSPFGEGCFGESNYVYLVLDETAQETYGCKIVVLADAVKYMQDYLDKQFESLA